MGRAGRRDVRLHSEAGSGGDAIALDKQNFNKRLNGIVTGLPDRAFDLNASGGAPNAVDKQIMNRLLNGIAIP